MLEVSFEIGGRKINPRNIKDTIEGMIISSIEESVRKSVRNVRCKEHGESPRLKIKGRDIDNLSIDVSSCCEDLQSKVEKALK